MNIHTLVVDSTHVVSSYDDSLSCSRHSMRVVGPQRALRAQWKQLVRLHASVCCHCPTRVCVCVQVCDRLTNTLCVCLLPAVDRRMSTNLEMSHLDPFARLRAQTHGSTAPFTYPSGAASLMASSSIHANAPMTKTLASDPTETLDATADANKTQSVRPLLCRVLLLPAECL